MRELRILKPIARLEHARVLDPVIERVHGIVDALLKPRALEDVLHGVPAGHPLHPALVLVPAGAWISAAVLSGFNTVVLYERIREEESLLNESAAYRDAFANRARFIPGVY